MKPVLVGEVNPYGVDPFFALYPLPEHASGGRLAKILGLTRGEYLRRFERVNLCVGHWSAKQARVAAELLDRASSASPLLLLGRRVARAFEYDAEFWTSYVPAGRLGRIYLIPHPSAMNRVWNDPRAVVRTRDFLAEFLRP